MTRADWIICAALAAVAFAASVAFISLQWGIAK